MAVIQDQMRSPHSLYMSKTKIVFKGAHLHSLTTLKTPLIDTIKAFVTEKERARADKFGQM